MDVKTLKATVIGLLLTLIIGSIYTMTTRRLEAGGAALTAQEIKKVMNEVLVTDAGDSYAQALNKVENRMLISETKNDEFHRSQTAELERIRTAVEKLAAE
jgi:hypothetical protein